MTDAIGPQASAFTEAVNQEACQLLKDSSKTVFNGIDDALSDPQSNEQTRVKILKALMSAVKEVEKNAAKLTKGELRAQIDNLTSLTEQAIQDLDNSTTSSPEAYREALLTFKAAYQDLITTCDTNYSS